MVTGWQNEDEPNRANQKADKDPTNADSEQESVNNEKQIDQIPATTGGWLFNN